MRMKTLKSKQPTAFIDYGEKTFGESAAVVLPVPYDGTITWTTWGAGCSKGPAAIIRASPQLEIYDEELETEPSTMKGIHTMPAIKPAKKPEQVVGQVADAVGKILAAKKFPIVLGGEHSITPGSVRAAKKFYPDLTVLQFDAHSDLRDEYKGTKWSHACAARRCADEGAKIVQVGLRSICDEDSWFIEKFPQRVKAFLMKDEDKWTADDVAAACGKNVFISFDLDAFDSSVMPATSTPEPGGLSWKRALSIIRRVAQTSRIVGADVVELSPTNGLFYPDFTAAKLAYKIISYALFPEKLGKK